MQRWCTRALKIEPLRAYHDTVIAELGNDTDSMRDENLRSSASRRAARRCREWADDDEWGGYTWRPLIAWSVADVIAIHHRHAIPMNPLYLPRSRPRWVLPLRVRDEGGSRADRNACADADRCNSR